MIELLDLEPWAGSLWPSTGPPAVPIPLHGTAALACSPDADPSPTPYLDPDPIDLDLYSPPQPNPELP